MVRVTLVGVSAIAILGVAGCDNSRLQDFTPPPSAYVEPPMTPPAAAPEGRVETTELLGGPPPPVTDDAPVEPEVSYGGMAPIPNPEDLSPDERERVYGPGENAPAPRFAAPVETLARAERPAQSRNVRRVQQPERPRASTTTQSAPRAQIAAPAGPVTSRPVAPAPKPAPQVAAKPVAPATPAPAMAVPAVKTPTPAPVPVKPVKPQTKAEQLGAAVAADVTAGSKFDIPAAVVAGQEGVVVLTLPEGLLVRIQAEAAKLGMTVPARTVDTHASLTGDGYAIVPNASQAARLKAGEATSFAWQVKPGTGQKEPLKVEIGGELKGGAKPVAFPITTIEQVAAAPAPAPVESGKKGFDWKRFFGIGKDRVEDAASEAGDTVAGGADAVADGAGAAAAKGKGFIDGIAIPGSPTVTLPTGPVRSGYVVLIGLAVLTLLIISAISNAARRRRRAAERRRKFRTMADFGGEAETTTEHGAHHEPAEQKREPENA